MTIEYTKCIDVIKGTYGTPSSGANSIPSNWQDGDSEYFADGPALTDCLVDNKLPLRTTVNTDTVHRAGDCAILSLDFSSLVPAGSSGTAPIGSNHAIKIHSVKYAGYDVPFKYTQDLSAYDASNGYIWVHTKLVAVALSTTYNDVFTIDIEYTATNMPPNVMQPIRWRGHSTSFRGVKALTAISTMVNANLTATTTSRDTVVALMSVNDGDGNNVLPINGGTGNILPIKAWNHMYLTQSIGTIASGGATTSIVQPSGTYYGKYLAAVSLDPGTTPANIDPYDSVTVSASTTSASATLPPGSGAGSIKVTNGSASIAYVRWGAGAQTAVATDRAVAPNSSETFKILQTDIDTVAVKLQTGTGSVVFQRSQS